ncbi:hypothetical protein TNCV_1302891 [Trichonephila clavipes]|nr:hypothetical protein TNCV_1302891 [Trichonephila clavipes]
MEMDNRNEPTDMDLIDSPRRTPTPPPLSACEQILQKQSPAAKDGDFQKFSWPASLNFKPCPITTRMSLSTDVPFRSFKKLKKQSTWRDSNIEEITGSQNAIPVLTPKPPSATGPTPSGNQNPVSTLPPPVMLRITETVRSQMKIINEKFPKIRSRTTGEFIKLYTDNLEQFHELLTFAEKTKFQFYEIKPKNERPIKVVLKGLPRNFKVEEIQADLEELGFTPEKKSANRPP